MDLQHKKIIIKTEKGEQESMLVYNTDQLTSYLEEALDILVKAKHLEDRNLMIYGIFEIHTESIQVQMGGLFTPRAFDARQMRTGHMFIDYVDFLEFMELDRYGALDIYNLEGKEKEKLLKLFIKHIWNWFKYAKKWYEKD